MGNHGAVSGGLGRKKVRFFQEGGTARRFGAAEIVPIYSHQTHCTTTKVIFDSTNTDFLNSNDGVM